MTNQILALLFTPQFPLAHSSTSRREPRPEREQPKYWCPRLQQWVSLNEIAYLTMLATCCADLCHEKATVMDMNTGLEYCAHHFQEKEK